MWRVDIRCIDVVRVDFGGEVGGFDDSQCHFCEADESGDVVDGVVDGRGAADDDGTAAVHLGIRRSADLRGADPERDGGGDRG